jgi:hypothetical protein
VGFPGHIAPICLYWRRWTWEPSQHQAHAGRPHPPLRTGAADRRPGLPGRDSGGFGTSRANLCNDLPRECGLVTANAGGRRVRYELADQRLADRLRILAALDLPGKCG